MTETQSFHVVESMWALASEKPAGAGLLFNNCVFFLDTSLNSIKTLEKYKIISVS